MDLVERKEHPVEGSHLTAEGTVEHPVASDYGHARILPADRTWFQRAVFYEGLVRAFADSNADGAGDLRGLIEKLDYLKWLGADSLWLPPVYHSPLREGGGRPLGHLDIPPDLWRGSGPLGAPG